MNQILMMSFMIWGCYKKNAVKNSAPIEEVHAEESSSEKAAETVTPIFDRFTIDERIKEHTADIQACYQKALKEDSGVQGRIFMSFDIGQKGNVVNLEPKEDSLNSPELTACLVGVFSKIQFPAGMQSDIVRSDGTRDQYVSVNYPLSFAP